MNEAATLNARIETLETRIAYQDQIIEDLNKSVTEQWKQVESLAKQVDRLTDRVKDVEGNVAPSGAAEPPPPHY